MAANVTDARSMHIAHLLVPLHRDMQLAQLYSDAESQLILLGT